MDLINKLRAIIQTQQPTQPSLGAGAAENARRDLGVTPDYWEYVLNETTAGRRPMNFQQYKTNTIQRQMQQQMQQAPTLADEQAQTPPKPFQF